MGFLPHRNSATRAPVGLSHSCPVSRLSCLLIKADLVASGRRNPAHFMRYESMNAWEFSVQLPDPGGKVER